MKYFIRHIHTYERARSMERQLMAFCRQKLGYVMTEQRLHEWVGEIRAEHDRIKKEEKRIQPAEIIFHGESFHGHGSSYITVGEGYIGLDEVKGEEE